MDKLKAFLKKKKDKFLSPTKTETNGATAPKPTPTDTAAAPSTSDPATAPAGEYPDIDGQGYQLTMLQSLHLKLTQRLCRFQPMSPQSSSWSLLCTPGR